MKRLSLWLLFFAVLGIQSALAQTYKVKGNVVSKSDNEPLIGVSILQKGTTNGVVTDIDGNYELQIQGGETTLVFSYIGLQTQELKVNARTGVLNVAMEDDSHLMDDVVVVAYGVRKKGTIAGSVSTVKNDKLENVPAPSFDQALQGQTTGLSVISNSGEPSKAATFQIRGTNSINSGTAPLFILDGVPISSSDFNTISPSDIESISVLKDASSTSIYGARAANGVVVITTKRGLSMDKAKVTFRAQYGFSQLAQNNWNMMNTAERIQYEKEIGIDTGKDYDVLSRTDINWLDMVFNDRAPLQNYEVSVNRATDRLNYFVSGGFYDQDGIAQSSTFRRYNMRANAEVKASDWLKVGTNSMVAYEEVEQADDGSYALYTPISACRFMLPYWNPYNEDGSLASENDGTWTGTGSNPIEWMANNPVTNKKYKVLSTVFAEITPIKNLTIRAQFGADYSHSTAFMQSFPSYIINNETGTAGRNSSDMLNLTETTTVNYRWELNSDHSFNFLLGQEGVDYRSEGFQVITSGQSNDFLTNISSGTRASSWADSTTSYSYLSFFGRGEYNYKDLYYADFSVRADASSRFGTGNRWAGFWSLGFMWNLKSEPFLKDIEWLSSAQIALSTGTSGNSSIPDYDHLALVSGKANYEDQAGIYPSQSGNEDLSWEKLWSSNVALRLGFIDRINLDIEFYNKKTTNMLMLVPDSYALTGEGEHWDNIGAMLNRGVEFNVSADVIRTKDFVWSVNANASYNKNKLLELYNGVQEYEVSTTATKLVVGHSVSEFYINRYAGVNPANGDALWYTKDGQITNEYNEGDKVMTGKTFDAPWQGGFGTSLAWKGFSLAAQFSWVADRWMFNNDRYFEESNGLYAAYNQSKRLLYDRWKQPGDITDIPRHGVTPQFDDRFLENASFLRLKNVTLAYAFPQRLLSKSNFFSSARIYLQGQNLLTFTGFTGLDPESSSNVYKAQYPMSRQFTLGVEVSF
ncbi:TonB-dependent receptor [uncultured Phocaeicola sp.]|uniref:SusC/RagA family TonB-linked outer membrane protein n=1 Tax=uncultured Phocaeicola sp. TaxID=990718 RepID=UPI0025D40641|nr:TonB-dependent receptor [uncultured Phocaeicola sp.]